MDFFASIAFPWVEDVEKGFTKDPRDAGNWTGGHVGAGILKGTKYGVSAKSFPDLDIENLTMQDAASIARTKYWTPAGCDHLPEAVALCVFDFAYNAGVHESVKILQRALGLTEDGAFGSHTQAAATAEDPRYVVSKFTAARIDAYTQMHGWNTFGQGWRDRALHTQQKALSL